MALVHPQAFKIQGIKQLVRTPGSIYFTVDRHYRGTFETTRLCSIDDDSTTAEGWLQKSNFSKLKDSKVQSLVRIEAAQKQANLFMLLGLKSYSQWFKGECNEVADTLSMDDNRSDEDLTNIFL